ncbi:MULTISPECIES: hypothetical protein [unclassified Agrococcus]|uniref:hypothetical protein n=1 Tax=unclassified Agrococcus TaxID=2615065 RepID=UPI00360DA489
MSTTTPTRRLPRKKLIAGVAALFMLVGAGAAVAYWTTTGSGTGSAATGSSQPVVVVQTSNVTNLRPGAAAQTLSGTFNNPSGGSQYVRTVTASISSVTVAAGVTGTCTAADYTLAGATMTVNQNVAAGTGQGTWTGATIAFANDNARNQDACQGATVNLSYTSN